MIVETDDETGSTERENTRRVEVSLAVPAPRAVLALAEALGELAAELWLDGKIDIG